MPHIRVLLLYIRREKGEKWGKDTGNIWLLKYSNLVNFLGVISYERCVMSFRTFTTNFSQKY